MQPTRRRFRGSKRRTVSMVPLRVVDGSGGSKPGPTTPRISDKPTPPWQRPDTRRELTPPWQRPGTSRRTSAWRHPRTWPRRLRNRWEVYADGRIVTAMAIFAAFAMLIALPSGVAMTFRRDAIAPTVQSWLQASDNHTSVRVYQMETGHILTVPMGEYILDVLAAEMPPNAPEASLEAAAISARTYVVWAKLGRSAAAAGGAPASGNVAGGTDATAVGAGAAAVGGGQPGASGAVSGGLGATTVAASSPANASAATSGPSSFAYAHGADVTDTGILDLPLLTQSGQASQWGTAVNENRARLQQAIVATDGKILAWHGEPIMAFSFGVSPGQTRSAKMVFGKDIPYLTAVDCPDDVQVADHGVQTYSPPELAAALDLPMVGKQAAQLDKAMRAVRVQARDKAGFVRWVGGPDGQRWTGTQFADMLGLPSADFTLAWTSKGLQVHDFGSGPDIGLSLHETQVMAAQGDSSGDILAKFYPGTQQVSDSRWIGRS